MNTDRLKEILGWIGTVLIGFLLFYQTAYSMHTKGIILAATLAILLAIVITYIIFEYIARKNTKPQIIR